MPTSISYEAPEMMNGFEMLDGSDTARSNKQEQVSIGRRFIQFRTAFFNNYDFKAIQAAARSSNTISRTGSRTTTWKVSTFDFINVYVFVQLLLGVLPIQRNKELWMTQTISHRQKFYDLRGKYYNVASIIRQGGDPLKTMAL